MNKVITITSGKGGVGKTTFSCGLAEALSSLGLKVIVVENNKLPRAYANLDVDNYPDYEGDIKGVSSLLGAMMGNGTKNQSKDSYNEEVDYMGATLVLSASGGYVSSLKRYFPRILEMMADGLKNPKFTKEDFEKEKNVALESIKSIDKDVQNIANRVHSKLRFGANHPFGEFETNESLNNISLKDVQNYYKKYAIPNNAYLTIVGDVKYDEINIFCTFVFFVLLNIRNLISNIEKVCRQEKA